MRMFGFCWLGAVMLVASSGPALAQGDAAKGKAAFAKCAICAGRQDPGRAGA